MKAFPVMLKGLAQDHFYNHRLSQRTYNEACASIRGFFEGPGSQRSALDRWNSVSLADLIAKNPEKSTYEVVQQMINDLRQLQYGLSSSLQNEDFLHNKIVTSCQGFPACRFAVSDPPLGLGPLINKLQSSITSYEKEQQVSASYYTDRRFHTTKYRGNLRSGGHNFGQRHHKHTNHTSSNTTKSCFICKREHCRSWKHSPEEQEAEKVRFRNKNLHQFSPAAHNSPGFNKRFNKEYATYVALNTSLPQLRAF